jgi:hypothetical protein
MSQPVPWLPDACLESERAARRTGETVADWSRRWIAGGRWQALGRWSETAGDDEAAWSPLRSGRATIEAAPGAVTRLALAMLGEENRSSFTLRDHKFLRRLAGRAIDDLAALIDALLPVDGGSAGTWAGIPWSLPVGATGEPLMRISIARADLCQLAHQAFPRGAASALASRGSAVADLRVSIGAHLGMTAMDIAQVAALEPGDVIVLDRQLSAPATLLVAGRQTALACTLRQKDASLVLELTEPA